MTDLELELEALAQRLCRITDQKEFAPLWLRFVGLHGKRSPEVVAKMETERGLK